MQTIRTHAYARAALAGNPSDGYWGKTLSFTMRDFAAHVELTPADGIEIVPNTDDLVRFDTLSELSTEISRFGYYGGLRLVKAALKRFHDYAYQHGIDLPRRGFSLRYTSDIPRGVGLAGSSAIIVATWRALMSFYEIEVDRRIMPNWILAVERDELRIMGGLQDRVAQVYEGLTFMDFERNALERDGFGRYESLDASLLPPIYLAYQTELAETSDIVHNDLRERWNRGDETVHQTMQDLAAIAMRARACLERGEPQQLGALIDANFELRRAIVPINKGHAEMVAVARSCGASAHFAGSGGAIVGTYGDESDFRNLQSTLGGLGCRVLQPTIA